MKQKAFLVKIILPCIFLFFTLMDCSKERSVQPILILAGNKDYGIYTGEILKAEGFNEFIADSLGNKRINKSFLAQFDLIILTEQVNDSQTWNIFRKYVRNGGNLIAFEPFQIPADLFGIEKIPGEIGETYLSIDTSSREGKSLTSKMIKIHGIVNKYALKNAKTIAWFCHKADSKHDFPAIVTGSYGKGETAAFLYNLPGILY